MSRTPCKGRARLKVTVEHLKLSDQNSKMSDNYYNPFFKKFYTFIYIFSSSSINKLSNNDLHFLTNYKISAFPFFQRRLIYSIVNI